MGYMTPRGPGAESRSALQPAAISPPAAALAKRQDLRSALRHGATPEELMVAAEMRAGGAYAHSAVSLVAMDEAADRAPSG
jgi:hypothetical protein